MFAWHDLGTHMGICYLPFEPDLRPSMAFGQGNTSHGSAIKAFGKVSCI